MRIHQVSLRFSESYLIEVDQGLILVDAGLPGSENQILKEIKQLQFSDLKITSYGNPDVKNNIALTARFKLMLDAVRLTIKP